MFCSEFREWIAKLRELQDNNGNNERDKIIKFSEESGLNRRKY
jgi:hypothetical protein